MRGGGRRRMSDGEDDPSSGRPHNSVEEEDEGATPGRPLTSSRPDLAPSNGHRTVEGSLSPGAEGGSRRDETPFSLKHFLSRGSSLGGCSSSSSGGGGGSSSSVMGGARPKVYPTGSPRGVVGPPSPTAPPVSAPPDHLSATSGLLPDFVQDHLVIEQCYLSGSGPPPQLDLAALDAIPPPQYQPQSPESDFGGGGVELGFDLMRRSGLEEPPVERLALDLGGETTAGPAPEVVGSSKSLPDFLSDGPIRSQRRLDPSQPSTPLSTEHRLQIENDRLRRELDSLRRQLSDQITRSETLEAELCLLRSRDQSETLALEKVVEQVEDNLKRATKRAVNAENQVSKLKETIQKLTMELASVRGSRGNRDGATASTSANLTESERLASQLRSAANSAELSLRQLLMGVDNLRSIAESLEPRRRMSCSDDSQDEGNEPGPAL